MALLHFAAGILLHLALELSCGAQAQFVQVLQSPETIAVTAGESAIFSCTVPATGGFVDGPVRWFKGCGGSRTLIYTDTQEERPVPRVFRVSPVSIMDFSINITNVSTEDAGTYYCVKFQKIFFEEVERASATGTCLSVSGGVQAQTIEVLQFPETIIIAAGESATFSCTITVTGGFVIGPVQWFKGSGKSRTLIYSEKVSEGPYPRVSRVSPDSNTDMSIRITNVSTGDNGTYYCVKFNRASSHEEEQRSGPGTVLSVREEAPGSSGVYISSQTLWIGFVVEKLCLMAFVLGCIYLKQRF